MTEQRVDARDPPLMTARKSDPNGSAFTFSADHVATSTGISAAVRALIVWTRSAAWGHGFPLRANAGEVLARSGHTEAGDRPACGGRCGVIVYRRSRDSHAMGRATRYRRRQRARPDLQTAPWRLVRTSMARRSSHHHSGPLDPIGACPNNLVW